MSDKIATELADDLRSATLDHVWRQWKAVGGTVSSNVVARAIIDPEALLLMSLWMLEHERRLADVVWSWVSVNSPLLSLQRLRNLRADFPTEVARRLTGLARVRVEEARDHRWKALQKGTAETLSERSGKVRAVNVRPGVWACLVLQLRLGLGVGIKADVLAYLLGTSTAAPSWAGVASIADALGYTNAAVRRAADDLARARFIRLLDTSESEQPARRMFSGHPGTWMNVLGVTPAQPGWGYWRERYTLVVEILTSLARFERKQLTSYAMDVESRDILKRHGLALRLGQVVDPGAFSVAELDFTYLVDATRQFISWLRDRG